MRHFRGEPHRWSAVLDTSGSIRIIYVIRIEVNFRNYSMCHHNAEATRYYAFYGTIDPFGIEKLAQLAQETACSLMRHFRGKPCLRSAVLTPVAHYGSCVGWTKLPELLNVLAKCWCSSMRFMILSIHLISILEHRVSPISAWNYIQIWVPTLHPGKHLKNLPNELTKTGRIKQSLIQSICSIKSILSEHLVIRKGS